MVLNSGFACLLAAAAVLALGTPPPVETQAKSPPALHEYLALTARPAPDANAADVRKVDGIAVPPFGCSLESSGDKGFSWYEGFFREHLATWPGPPSTPSAEAPLSYGKWTGGPYRNPSGERWATQINEWYQDGSAAGLGQDTFRSFDKGHSSLRAAAYPQMKFEDPVPAFGVAGETIFRPRVTMGVQSYGIKGQSVIETSSRQVIRSFYESENKPLPLQRFYRTFYENNFFFVAPAVHSFSPGNDAFAFLSPFYLHSVGASGTDSKLLKPLVFASAALPPDLKTRMLREGLFVPTLMYLFKSHIAGGITAADAHVAAYALPAEAAEDFDGPPPFLDGLLTSAHELEHIPPVCRFHLKDFSIVAGEDHAYGDKAYFENNTYAFAGALRQGQEFVLTVDLRYSWTDQNRPITAYHVSVLRGKATVEPLNEEGSLLRITIPWRPTNNRFDLRTDVVLLVNDGAYYSAPAYLSVRHLHKLDPITLGIKSTPPKGASGQDQKP